MGGRRGRLLTVPFSPGFVSIAGYRLSRALYLALGPGWTAIRACLAPVRMLLRPLGAGLEIHPDADIGPGLLVLHSGLGVVVAGTVTAGRDLVLTGGNCISGPAGPDGTGVVLGDGVVLGVHAVVLGPGRIGGGVTIGAASVVIGDAPTGSTMVGAPARPVAARSEPPAAGSPGR